MKESEIRALLDAVREGRVDVGEAMTRLRDLPFEDAGVAMIDHHRSLRQGAAEVVFGEGKTAEQISTIIERLAARGTDVLVTRLDEAKSAAVTAAFPDGVYHADARTFTLRRASDDASHDTASREAAAREASRHVAVVCAGTSDLPVAREAVETLRFLGHEVDAIVDVGVAGLHRLLAHRERLHDAAVVIVVAGMEGALPSVVGGLLGSPVIAVPTSVGYGAAFGGIAALLGMLNSCAAGVTVVNIDNGFGAAFAAHRILRGDAD